MNHEHEDAHCQCPRTADFDSAGPAATGRRSFLRNAGLLGAGATALASGATVFGPAATAAAVPAGADAEANRGASSVYDVTAIDTDEPGARWNPDPEDPVFTLVVMPDTQYMFDEDRIHPAPMEASFRYILSGDEDANVVFMAHLGDITQNGQAGEFAAAGAVFEMLDRKKAAYSVVAGNHDVSGTDQRGATPYPRPSAARAPTATTPSTSSAAAAATGCCSGWTGGFRRPGSLGPTRSSPTTRRCR
jgi:hypothetical protein